ATDNVGKEAAQTSRIVGRLDAEQVQAWRNAQREIEKTEEAYVNYIERAKRQTFSRDAVGDVSTFLGSLGSVTSIPGGNPLTDVLRAGGDIAGVAEYYSNIREAVARAGLAAAKSTGSLGEMAATLSSLLPGLGAAGAGLGALALAAA